MRVRPRGAANPYGWEYQKARAAMLAERPRCVLRLVCAGALATTADHTPPLSRHFHAPGSGCCTIQPACKPCQQRQAAMLGHGARARRRGIPTPSRQW
jgi:hypothetical protein